MPLTHIIASVLFVQAVRYLLFDHGLFEFIWKHFRDTPILKTFLSCPFCQGFWLGLIVFIPQTSYILAAGWAFAGAWISLSWSNWANKKTEKKSGKISDENDIETCTGATDEVVLLECNIDDMSGEFFGDIMHRLFASGALDVWFTSVYGKKNRPLYQLSAIMNVDDEETGIREILTHTSTAGVRRRIIRRTIMDRHFIKTKVDGEVIAVKCLKWKDIIKYTPEWEDCVKASAKLNKTVSEIYTKAQALAREQEY